MGISRAKVAVSQIYVLTAADFWGERVVFSTKMTCAVFKSVSWLSLVIYSAESPPAELQLLSRLWKRHSESWWVRQRAEERRKPRENEGRKKGKKEWRGDVGSDGKKGKNCQCWGDWVRQLTHTDTHSQFHVKHSDEKNWDNVSLQLIPISAVKMTKSLNNNISTLWFLKVKLEAEVAGAETILYPLVGLGMSQDPNGGAGGSGQAEECLG